MECEDCGTTLTENEIINPYYNENWYEVCDVCFENYNFELHLYHVVIKLEGAVEIGLHLVESAQKIIHEIETRN